MTVGAPSMTDHASNRLKIVEQLRRELVGPAPAGEAIDADQEVIVQTTTESWGPWRQVNSGEEILLRDPPTRRYGVGVLFPQGVPLDTQLLPVGQLQAEPGESDPPADSPAVASSAGVIADANLDGMDGQETDDLDLTFANSYQPSTFGVSFLAEFGDDTRLILEAGGGRYEPRDLTVRVGDTRQTRRSWLRRSVCLRAEYDWPSLNQQSFRKALPTTTTITGAEGLDVRIEVFTRPHGPRKRLITACLVNRCVTDKEDSDLNPFCLFQAHMTAVLSDPDGRSRILPYPEATSEGDLEESSIRLLYRHVQTFATGHGCSADWEKSREEERAHSVSAECFPVTETPSITPDVLKSDGSLLTVSMASLAGLIDGNDGSTQLEEVVRLYEIWIADQRDKSTVLAEAYRSTAVRHLRECEQMAERMREGLAYLRNDPQAKRAFQLANHASLLQQTVTRSDSRAISYDRQNRQFSFAEPLRPVDPLNPPEGRGAWRAFQIGFLLAAVKSTAEPGAHDRETVELIWFPTGGGKTEAYLALAAFAAFKRRLKDPDDVGVHILMRYTLRLLTTQQFQRAGSLICAMEHLRRNHQDELGHETFSAGIWVGGDTTPNNCERALKDLSDVERSQRARNPFLLERCPWCAAQFGRLDISGKGSGNRGSSKAITPGYTRGTRPRSNTATVLFRCPDAHCEFSSGLPVYVIDEDIYEVTPTLVIGTIDKFAILAWKPEAASLFGLDANGERVASPPGLIIQDELHLISGPLGSLAGLYEPVIEDLCTDKRATNSAAPKIVCSTATIRSYEEQIQGLYDRTHVALFPPRALRADDSFFARYDLESSGRIYAGVHATSLGSVQTEWVRTFSALFQGPMPLEAEARDPWWTMLVFFNSIREMGTAHTLFQSDIPDYEKIIWSRDGTPISQRRYTNSAKIFELTGGLPSDELSGAIARLELAYGKRDSLDVCLSSNIIEVGIDISRLSLMVVAGQPKTTSQYIQVTGRVGRLRDRPGLIITMYSPSKPRDRSHYERFKSYHARLYAQVEPTSVTPFSPPAIDRALHAALTAYARLVGGADVARSPYPYPANVVERFKDLMLARAESVDPEERAEVKRVVELRARQWQSWQRTIWSGDSTLQDAPLLRPAGEYADAVRKRISWATPTSMRNVDAACEAEITTQYLEDLSAEDAETTS